MSVNKVILIGNLGRDPEMRTTGNGTAVCNLNLATTESWKDKNGEKREKTEWHRCVAWGKQAETIGKYMTKGSKVYIEGSLETQEWEKDGEKRYTTQVRVKDFQFLDSKKDGQRSERPSSRQGTGGYGDDGGYGSTPSQGYGGADDDIPF